MFFFLPLSLLNCSQKNMKLKYFIPLLPCWCDDVQWVVIFYPLAVMCCIHLFTWHTLRLPRLPRRWTSKFISPWGRKLYVQQKFLCELPKNHPPGGSRKKCNVINTENLCLQKYNFSYFFLGFQGKYHAYDMPCCVHFTGYNQQLKFLVHYSSFSSFLHALPKTKMWKKKAGK